MAKRKTTRKANQGSNPEPSGETPRPGAAPDGSVIRLRHDAALGNGTRERGFVFGETDGGLNWNTFNPTEGVSGTEIRNAKWNPDLFVIEPRTKEKDNG